MVSTTSLLRAETFASVGQSANRPETQPRILGARVLRADQVGLQPAVSVKAPARTNFLSAVDRIEEPEPALSDADREELREAAKQQGFSVGYEAGHVAGLAAAEETMALALERMQTIIATMHESHSTFFRAAERQVVDLALQIAQKVVEREVENLPDLAVNVIHGALEEMDARTALRVRVNPEDVEVLRRRWSQVVPSGLAPERIDLQADERVQPGGGIIETTHGSVDAQLESKLSQLGNALWTFVMDVDGTDDESETDDA
ncbi:MAG: hypothetical protein NVSMB2_14430 [Chloroflexota bacterium]